MFERFTDRARRVLVLAQEEARLLNHSYIGTEHILLGLLHEGEGIAAKTLESLGIELEQVRERIVETIGPAGTAPAGSPPFTPRAKKVLELSLREALQLGHNHIGTEHLLLGLVREGEGVAAQVLVNLGADLSTVRQQVIQLLSGYEGKEAPWPPAWSEEGRHLAQVGEEWSAEVVRAGRKPSDYLGAYQALARLVNGLGVDLDTLPPSRISVSSVDTNLGPGLRLVVRREPDDPSDEPSSGDLPDLPTGRIVGAEASAEQSLEQTS